MKSKRVDKKRRKTKKNAQSGGGVVDKKIKNTIMKVMEKRNLGSMLQVVCRDPNNCLALGVYDEYIKAHFNDFRDLEQVDMRSVKKIGSESKNGFVLELPFVKDGFKAYTVLKCTFSEYADSLFYEFLVGKYFINKYTKKLPCFVETYDLYEFNHDPTPENVHKITSFTDSYWGITRIKTSPKIDMDKLHDNLEESCLYTRRRSVLVQHLNNVRALEDMRTKYYEEFKSDMFSSLYQVYYALTMLKDKFTHYDMHGNNILVYKPFGKQKYIRMRYHYGDGKTPVEFKTEYIVKIIDYGRCFVDINGFTTNEFMDKVCNACKPNCGDAYGYSVIQGSKDTLSTLATDGLDPTKLNNSHDLRLHHHAYRFSADFLNSILPSKSIPKMSVTYDTEHATLPATGNGSIGDIKSVVDMHDYLREHVMHHPTTKEDNDKKYNSSWTEAATMDIYDDGRDYVFALTTPSYKKNRSKRISKKKSKKKSL